MNGLHRCMIWALASLSCLVPLVSGSFGTRICTAWHCVARPQLREEPAGRRFSPTIPAHSMVGRTPSTTLSGSARTGLCRSLSETHRTTRHSQARPPQEAPFYLSSIRNLPGVRDYLGGAEDKPHYLDGYACPRAPCCPGDGQRHGRTGWSSSTQMPSPSCKTLCSCHSGPIQKPIQAPSRDLGGEQPCTTVLYHRSARRDRLETRPMPMYLRTWASAPSLRARPLQSS